MTDFTPYNSNYQTIYIKTSIIFKLGLDQDILEVFAKFQLVSGLVVVY